LGILLLIAELNQNSTLMRAQIFNERAAQGIDVFMTVSESPELSEITRQLRLADWPENSSAYFELSPVQQNQYWWFLRSERFRIENLLYQQILGILENDTGPLSAGRRIIKVYEAIDGPGGVPRLRRLVAEVEAIHAEDNF
jgi:hypothetical protein